MTELEKFQKVNACETIEELQGCILSFAADTNGYLQGRSRSFKAANMVNGAQAYYDDRISEPNVVTREYGLRQQLIYLKHYKK